MTANRVCPSGWYPFGTHAGWDTEDIPEKIEFSDEVDDAGMPLWERPRVNEILYRVRLLPGGPRLKSREMGGKKYSQYKDALAQFERLHRAGHNVKLMKSNVTWKTIKESRQ